MKVFLTPVLFFFFSGVVLSQSGDYLITHTKPDIPNIDNYNFSIIQDNNGLICIANRSGILRYDGVNWELINTPSAVLSLAIDESNNLYAGCLNEFGKIDYQNRKYEFSSLSDGLDTHNDIFTQTIYHDGKIYFISEMKIILSDPNTGVSEIIYEIRDELMYINYVFNLKDSLYVNLSNQSIIPLLSINAPETEIIKNDTCLLVFVEKNPITDICLGGTYSGNLYSYIDDNAVLLPQSKLISEGNYLINDGVWINENLFAIATLDNGCFIFDIRDSSVVENINFKNGLPDNEVYTIFCDYNHGLWVAHEFGFSRIVPEIPIKSFSNYPGLEGNLISLNKIRGRLYVTTSTGAYFFDKVNEYKNEVYYIVKEKTASTSAKKSKKEKQIPDRLDKSKRKKNRKGILGFGRNKKNPENIENISESKGGLVKRIFDGKDDGKPKEKSVKSIKKKSESGNEYIRRTRKKLMSSRFVYTAINGLDTKCKQVNEYKGKVLVTGPSGVYEIAGDSAIQVIDEPVFYLYVSPDDQHLILSCYDRSIRLYEHVSDMWIELENLQFNEMILAVYEDVEDRLWLASPNLIYLAQRSDTSIVVEKEFPYANSHFNIPIITRIDQKPYFINNEGYFYYEDDAINRNMNLIEKIGFPNSYLTSSDGNAWIFNGKNWYLLEDSNNPILFEYLSMFPKLEHIHYNPSGDNYWLITGENDINVFDPEIEDDVGYDYNDLIFKAVMANDRIIEHKSKFQLKYFENTLSFEIVQPDYLGLLNIEYQYKLDGMMEDWSNWMKVNLINFTYLQPGKYKLLVRSRDTFGRIQESAPFTFSINPPYWQTPWFYAVEFFFFLGLVLLSIRMNRWSVKYRFVTAGLSILTLILIIEFIQSTAQGYLGIQSTPIVDFGINVGIAIFVFPLEQLLRKYMMGKTINDSK